MEKLRELLRETQDVIPCFALARVAHPVVVEMFALAGEYRAFWMDQEHASFSSAEMATLSLAGRAHGLNSFVRMPPTGYWQVSQALEAGAAGVMAAQIHHVDEAAQFAAWAKFAPQGTRGLNSSGQDAGYSHIPLSTFVNQANDNVMVAIQVETMGALEQAEEIAALPEVDMLFVGPADLSLVLGAPGDFECPALWDAIERVATACQQHGKAWGAVTPTPAFAARAIELGCRLPTVGNDVVALRQGIAKLQASFTPPFPAG